MLIRVVEHARCTGDQLTGRRVRVLVLQQVAHLLVDVHAGDRLPRGVHLAADGALQSARLFDGVGAWMPSATIIFRYVASAPVRGEAELVDGCRRPRGRQGCRRSAAGESAAARACGLGATATLMFAAVTSVVPPARRRRMPRPGCRTGRSRPAWAVFRVGQFLAIPSSRSRTGDGRGHRGELAGRGTAGPD